jgi:NADH-quinone oxidoreductase subunit N
VNAASIQALAGYLPLVLPELVLGVVACAMFLGGTWRGGRNLWGGVALVGLAMAGAALAYMAFQFQTVQAKEERIGEIDRELKNSENAPTPEARKRLEAESTELDDEVKAAVYVSPVANSRLALFLRVLALAGGAVLVLTSWKEVPDETASEFHACLLLITAGVGLTGAANELITLFLSLELVSIPTYILLYLPRGDARVQESAMKYFLLSIFSSALLLFGFSYLYGTAGTTNLTALTEALTQTTGTAGAGGLALTALVLVTAGLGFRITAVPFHFYAPDVYQGTTSSAAAILSFVPKVAGFAALLRVFGYTLGLLHAPQVFVGQVLGGQGLQLLWILAAVTMTLGNVLALLQNNLRRLMAYSSVAHAGYMLVGLAAAPLLGGGAPVAGVEALMFYLVAYAAMTIGVFAVLAHLQTPERPVEDVDDLAGLSVSRPGMALLLVVFLFSLIGMPLTAGFWAKLQVIFGAMDVPPDAGASAGSPSLYWFFVLLAVLTAINAAVGAWYYLRVAAVMYLRTPLRPVGRARFGPVLVAVWLCALVTLAFGLYPRPLQAAVRMAVRGPAPAPTAGPATAEAAPGR